MASEQEYQALINVYQKKVSDLMAQTIALEARIIVMSSQLNSIQQTQMQSNKVEQPVKPDRRVNTKKSEVDNGEF